MVKKILKSAHILHQQSKSIKYSYIKSQLASHPINLVCRVQYWNYKSQSGAPSFVYDAKDEKYQVSARMISRFLVQLGLRSKAGGQFKYKVNASARHDIILNTLARQLD